MQKSDTISLRIDAQTKEQLQRIADAEDRTLSYVAARILRQWIEEKTEQSESK